MNVLDMINSRDINLERRVLSSIAVEGKIPHNIKGEYFSFQEKRLFDMLNSQWQEFGQIDTSIILDKDSELFELIDHTAFYGKEGVQKLRDHYLWRTIGNSVAKIKNDNASSAITELIEVLGTATLDQTGNIYNHSKAMGILAGIIEKGCLKKEGEVQGYSTGIRKLDDATGGIEPGKVYVLGALKKTGKSRFMIYLAIQMALQKAGVLINSLEMQDAELNALALSYFTGINSAQLGRRLSDRQKEAVGSGLSQVHSLGWTINRDYYVSDLRNRILYVRQKRKVEVVFIDFIQRMKTYEYANDRTRSVESIAMGMADIAKELNVAIVELGQLSGAAEKLDSEIIPDMSFLKESQGVAENMDVSIMMHNPERKSIQARDPYSAPVFSFKIDQRYDLSGSVVKAYGDMRCCRFSEYEEGADGDDNGGF